MTAVWIGLALVVGTCLGAGFMCLVFVGARINHVTPPEA